MNVTFNLHRMTATDLATLEALLRRHQLPHHASEVAAEGLANAGDEYADAQETADRYFEEND